MTMTMTESVLIVGATSGIARALCHTMAQRGCSLVLAGRNMEELERVRCDLNVRYGVDVFSEPFDALAFEQHGAFVERCLAHVGGDLTGAVLCHGYLPEQPRTETDFAEARRTFDINFLSMVSLLAPLAHYFEKRRGGYLAVLSSVAGDRGRQSNYTYGASKAALSVYLQGLRNRLHDAGVCVLTVKPGFVDTPMTEGIVNPRSPLVASPEKVARDIDCAIGKRKNVVYTPWFWRPIMAGIACIPEVVFKRMKL